GGGRAVSLPAAPNRSDPIRDADRIVRLAIEAERQQDAGDVAGAIKTLAKIEEATRAWQDRLTPRKDAAEQHDRWRQKLSARDFDPDFARAHFGELLKQVGDCQSCHAVQKGDAVEAAA